MRLGLFDLHAHLDFDPDPLGAAREAAACGLGVFSATVEPLSYGPTVAALAGCSNVQVGLGLHPWWVREGMAGHVQIEAFERLASDARFIGEVGLDLGRAHAHTATAQRMAFERVARACAGGGKVLSIHAVRAAGEVMDAMERPGALRGNACVFHWFSGTSDELNRALELGFFCSVNPRMLESRRGRAYARAIPEARLLLETDLPAQGEPYDAPARAEQLSAMLDTLAELRAVPRESLACAIARTSRELLGFAY